MATNDQISEAAKVELKDASRFLFFEEAGSTLAASFTANPAEFKPITGAFGDRDEAIKHGITLQGIRYEIHRHHPPLLYGRTMTGTPESSEGLAVCKVEKGRNGTPVYGVITYQMPNVSARMVPLLQKFCEQHLAAPGSAEAAAPAATA